MLTNHTAVLISPASCSPFYLQSHSKLHKDSGRCDRIRAVRVCRARASMAKDGPSINLGPIALLSGAGFLETAYLTYMKLAGSEPFCVEGSCTSILSSSYSTVFNIPLAALGCSAYGAVLLSSIYGIYAENPKSTEKLPIPSIKWSLVGLSSVLLSTSGYLMYILNTRLEGTCAYCVASAILSSAIFVLCMQGLDKEEMKKSAIPQSVLSLSLVLLLNTAQARADGDGVPEYIPFSQPVIQSSSTSENIQLVGYLNKIGAKMYGAFWCGHCYSQKEALGKQASANLDYVECFPDGFRKGQGRAKVCDDANIKGYPTWIINGKQYAGELELNELEEISGYSKQ